MDVLTIVFMGLIAHVLTDSGAQRAVFVAAPSHEARLIVETADVIENRGFERDANGAFKLEGERITIEGIAKGDATFEANFLRNVPSLARISDGRTLIPEIETASPHPAVAAYLDLGRGTFSAGETYGSRAAFGNAPAQCVASSVRFSAPTTGAVTFVTASGKSLRVRGGATVRISNEPPPTVRGTHFHMYANLFADATTIAEPVPAGACGTTEGGRRRVATHSVDPNCSNSHWP
jgi:hypothetical protein